MAGLALVGCAPFTADGPPPEHYLLRGAPEHALPAGIQHLPTRLAVERPTVPPGLDSKRIQVIRGDRQLDFVTDARWAEPLPDLLQAVLQETLIAARPDAISPQGRYKLSVRVRAFHPVYSDTGPPEIHVDLVTTLVDRRSGSMLAAARAARRGDAESDHLDAILAGLESRVHGAFLEAASDVGQQWRSRKTTREREPTARDQSGHSNARTQFSVSAGSGKFQSRMIRKDPVGGGSQRGS
jgi:ABC-type uncharacterized transport system auxiliary subunit